MIMQRIFRQRNIFREVIKSTRLYHSYPDPNEVPKITNSKSQITSVAAIPKEIDKLQLPAQSGVFMDVQYPGFEGNKTRNSLLTNAPITEQTTLSSGLIVASQDSFGLMSSFLFVIGSGSAFEKQIVGVDYNGGATHMLEILAFKSTYQDKEHEIKTKIEKLGGMVQCVSNRESIVFCVDVLRPNAEAALELLADTVLSPHFSDEALESGRATMGFYHDEARAEILSRDAIVQAAYANQPLGNFHMCPLEKANLITDASIQSFRAQNLYGENCVVSGAGIEHGVFVKMIERIFKDIPSKKLSQVEVKNRYIPSLYTGGLIKNERPLKEPFVKIALGFETGGWTHKNFTTVCVLQSLLGGGSSFSAGGPGKGMYSRLYREVLNRHFWVEGAESFISLHEREGLLGIDGACPPEYVPDMISVMIDEFVRLTFEPVKAIELSRAKNMLKSMMLMQLESRLVLCEDIARQTLIYGKRRSPEEVCKEIDAVTEQDILELAQTMIKQNPAIGCVGENLSKVPSYNTITGVLDNYRNQLKLKGHLK